jgi:protein TonB
MLGQTARKKRGVSGALVSFLAHGAVIAFLVAAPAVKNANLGTAAPKVTFFQLPPPPPPPPPAAKTSKPKRPKKKPETKPTPTLVVPDPDPVKPKHLEQPKEKEDSSASDSSNDSSAKGGVEGGVPGGVEGGVVGGTPGGVVGGKGDAKPAKPKNVPEFVIKKDVIQQDRPRLSEVFKQSHRGQPAIQGLYDVCVGLDGHVYRVTPVKSVPGADDDIITGITNGWLYKPQQVPVCFKWKIIIEIK